MVEPLQHISRSPPPCPREILLQHHHSDHTHLSAVRLVEPLIPLMAETTTTVIPEQNNRHSALRRYDAAFWFGSESFPTAISPFDHPGRPSIYVADGTTVLPGSSHTGLFTLHLYPIQLGCTYQARSSRPNGRRLILLPLPPRPRIELPSTNSLWTRAATINVL
jgi:hypothetical protein